MMSSMYTAVSGLRTHQNKMDVIGHNIANVNTVGYKRGQVTFKEAYNQMLSGASAPNLAQGKGGTNPQQKGLGVSTGSISTVHTIGGMQRTDNPTDLMINGEGFFTVSNDKDFKNRFYTRDGSLKLDASGNLVTSDGYVVLGYEFDKNGNKMDGSIKNIRINKTETVEPEATKNIRFRGNLDSNTPEGGKVNMDAYIYDSLGNRYELSFEFEKGAIDPDTKEQTWTAKLKRLTDTATGNYTEDIDDGVFGDVDFKFDHKGKLIEAGGNPIENADISLNGAILSTIKLNKKSDGGDLDPEEATSGMFSDKIEVINKDKEETYNNITQYASESDLKLELLNGNSAGTLDGFTIDSSGTVIGRFTNGGQKALGQILLSKFDNPTGLEKIGDNLFVETRNSGTPDLGYGGALGFGGIAGGTLEMSNVDISFEFTEMITTQRGFQANSRVITTSDEMLQELVNIKR